MYIEMPQDQNGFRTRFSELLRTGLETCRFSSREADYSPDEIRQGYYHDHELVENDVWVGDLSHQTIESATTLLKKELSTAGVNWDKVHLDHSLIPPSISISGGDPLALIQCALRGAAILGPERATDIVSGWLHGSRLGYVRNYAVNRLNLDSRITLPCELGYGACIREYRPHEHSAQVQSFIHRDNPGQLHLAQLRCRGRRALYSTEEDSLYDDERLNLVKGEVLLSVLSIETGNFIADRYTWADCGDLGAFIPRVEKPVTVNTGLEWPPEIPISPARLRRIRRNWQGVFRDVDVDTIPAWYYNVPVPAEIKRAFLASRRWRKASRSWSNGLLEDRFMELRTILDLLLSSDRESGTTNLSRMAKRAEQWIGTKGVNGRTTSQCVKRTYDIASRILHAGTFRDRDDVMKRYSEGLGITRKMLRRGLSSGFQKW